jgi:hypothetical protein
VVLLAIFKANYAVYGKRKLWKAAQRLGHDVGREQTARIMRQLGIRGASRATRRFTTHADAAHVRAPDLVKRDFTATRPNQLWVCDFTYCSTWSGVVYVAFVTDVFSRRIVGWKASRSMSADLVVDALNMAAWTRRHVSLEGLVTHSDAGSQYTSVTHTERLAEIGAAPSIGTVGDSFDKALVSHCTSLRRLGGHSLVDPASHAFYQSRVTGRRRLEEPSVPVIRSVRCQQPRSTPGFDGGDVHAKALRNLRHCEHATGEEPIGVTRESVTAAQIEHDPAGE